MTPQIIKAFFYISDLGEEAVIANVNGDTVIWATKSTIMLK